MDDNRDIKNKSIQKAVEVLNCFTKKPKLGVTEISEELGLYKSNVHNILTTLKSLNYLEQNEETGKYKLGIGIFALSRALGDSFSITKIARPYMQEIANSTNERVYLAVPSDDEVLYLESIHPAESIHLMRSIMGDKAKMYCTGIGKAMLAYLPSEVVNEYLNKEMTAYTENTIVEKETMLTELAEIRRRGYAIDDMEHEFGIKCVAVPIFDKERKIYGAMSISGPSLRFDKQTICDYEVLLKKYASIIENQIK